MDFVSEVWLTWGIGTVRPIGCEPAAKDAATTPRSPDLMVVIRLVNRIAVGALVSRRSISALS